MAWLQLILNIQQDAAPALEDALLQAKAVSITLEDNADQPIFEPALGETPLWQQTRLTGLFPGTTDTRVTSDIIADYLKGPMPPHRWEILEDKDWEKAWMENYQPIQCSDNFWICPSWLKPPQPEAINLILDPGLAFGSGTHPSTFLCLQWLATQNLHEKSVLDYGCGSGILAIAGLLLGAERARGIDIDPQALLATRDNAQRNSLDTAKISVHLPQQAPQEAADIVLANILAGPLVELKPALANLVKAGGKLCLSGILDSQVNTIIAVYSDVFTLQNQNLLDHWACITMDKKSQ